MAGDSSPPKQQSPQPSPNNSFSSSSSPPPDKDKSSSPPPSSPPPPPSKPSPSPPPPRQSNDYDDNDDNNNNNNNNNNHQNEGGESSSPSPPPPPPPPPQQSRSQSQSPPASNNTQSPAPPQSGQQSPTPPFSPPAPIGDQRNTPSSSTSTSGGTQQGVFVPPGSPNSPTTVSPTRSSPKQSSSSLNSNARSSSSSNSSSSSSSMHKLVVVGVAVGGFMLLLMVVICILCLRRRKRKAGMMPPYGWEHGLTPQGNQYWKPSPQDHTVKIPTPPGGYGHTNYNDSSPHSGPRVSSSKNPSPSLTLGFNKSSFTYDELAAATNGFDKANMLGQGGFGYVHKGVLPNGKVIAVKCLKSDSGQGEREFQAEVEIISRVHHRHLVSLVGYCSAAGQRMLVYEFVPNNNLEYHLHVKGDPPLSMSTRLRISLGSAKGLSYLHEDCHPRIIHRDIKASNILLDDNFEAMVADFGLAKLTTDTNTHVSTRVMGTFGYLAPEYAASGKLTEKSDVFSFGVMLLELITGRRPVDPKMKYMEDSLVDWARPLLVKALDTGNYDELADPRLEGNYNPHEMQRMVACAAACIRHSAKRRPKMSQIVRALEGDVSLEDLNDGKPGHVSMYGSSDGSDYDSRQYSADLKKFRRMAFETQDFEATSEYGGATSEYGLNPSSSSSDNSRDVN